MNRSPLTSILAAALAVMFLSACPKISDDNTDGEDTPLVDDAGQASGGDTDTDSDTDTETNTDTDSDQLPEGWQRIVKVRDEEERVYIYVKEGGRAIEGLTVFAIDGVEEVALINIVGTIDAAQLGNLIEDLDDLGGVDLEMDID